MSFKRNGMHRSAQEYREKHGVKGEVRHVTPSPEGLTVVWTQYGSVRIAEPLEEVCRNLRFL